MVSAHGGAVGAALEISAPVIVLLVLFLGPVLRRRRERAGTPPTDDRPDEPAR